MAEPHGTREFIGGGELGPHPETAAQTHGWRQPLGDYTENGPARIVSGVGCVCVPLRKGETKGG